MLKAKIIDFQKRREQAREDREAAEIAQRIATSNRDWKSHDESLLEMLARIDYEGNEAASAVVAKLLALMILAGFVLWLAVAEWDSAIEVALK